MNKSIIVYGPRDQFAKHARRIRKHFGADSVHYDWAGTLDISHGVAIYFTNRENVLKVAKEIGVPPVFSFAEVAKQINDAIPLTDWQSGPPPMVGEWISCTSPMSVANQGRETALRRYWKDGRWSCCYWPNEDETEKQSCVDNDSGYRPEELSWRGLSEEPIVVRSGA